MAAIYNASQPTMLSNLDNVLQQYNGTSSAILAAAIATLLIATTGYIYGGGNKSVLRYTPFLGQLGFFYQRHDFMDTSLQIALNKQRANKKDPRRGGVYKIKTVGYTVNVLHGDVGRKLFFGDKSMSLYQGYLFLRGGFPTTSNLGEAVEPDNNHLKTRLLYFVKREYITDLLPDIIKDIKGEISTWGNSGNIDLFENIYSFVFKLTCRLLVCKELADNDKLRKHVRGLYWNIEDAANSFTNLVPWIPTAQKRLSASSVVELSQILSGIMNARRKEGRRENDPLQYQMDLGDSETDIIQFIFKILFAGSVNTAAMSAWMIVYLASHGDYLKKVLDELRAAAAETGASGPLSEQIQHLTVDQWENDLPALERVSKETIRLVFAILALRRNVEEDVAIDGTHIGKGEFLAYPIHDAHLNPDIYPDPETWNPDRWLDESRNKDVTYPFLGWGVSRFPCTGMRLAKVEIKTIVALVVSSFDLTNTDGFGKAMAADPKPNRNDWQRFMPLESHRMNIKRTNK